MDCRQCHHVLEPEARYCGFCGRVAVGSWTLRLRRALAGGLMLLGTLTLTWWIGLALLTLYFRTSQTFVPNPWLPGVLPLLLVGLLRHPGRIGSAPCAQHGGQIFCKHCGNRLLPARSPLQLSARLFGAIPQALLLAGTLFLVLAGAMLVLQGGASKKMLAELCGCATASLFGAFVCRRIAARLAR